MDQTVPNQSSDLILADGPIAVAADAGGYFRVRRGVAEKNKSHVLYSDGGVLFGASETTTTLFSLFSRLPSDPSIEKVRLTPISLLLFTVKGDEKSELLQQLGLRRRSLTNSENDFWEEYESDITTSVENARTNLKVGLVLSTAAALVSLNGAELSHQESLELASKIAKQLRVEGLSALTDSEPLTDLLVQIGDSASLEKDYSPEKLDKVASVLSRLNKLLSDDQLDPEGGDARQIAAAVNNDLAKASAELVESILDPIDFDSGDDAGGSVAN